MPLKHCNHSASLFVYQRDSHKCTRAYFVKEWASFLAMASLSSNFLSTFSKLCRYLKSYTASQNLQRSGSRSVSLEGMSFERIVSRWQPREGNPANAEASQTLILFLLLPYHTMAECERPRASRNTHITINKAMLWMNLDFNSRKYQKSAQEFHGPHSWSQSRFQGLGQVHCSFWSCNWIKTRQIHEYCMIFLQLEMWHKESSNQWYFSHMLRALLIQMKTLVGNYSQRNDVRVM